LIPGPLEKMVIPPTPCTQHVWSHEVQPHDNFRMNTSMVDTAPLIIWLL
jgi:hypothetical protein